MNISFQEINDLPALAARWRALEAASQCGFFRGWTYLGTLLPHFSTPHLLAVTQDGQDIALGLFSMRKTWRGTRLSLHEAGAQPWDGITVEHNGLLLRQGAEPCIPMALAVAARHGAVILSGIDAEHLRAARHTGRVTGQIDRHAPAIDLAALTATGKTHLDTLSANARAQIRRAMRLYGAGLALVQAADVAEAHDFFDRLATLHQAHWTARGAPGAFAEPAIRAFHARLIATAMPRGEVALLRIAAGAREIGYLYQWQHGNRVMNYQAGLVAESDPHLKPGLVCHALAIEHARLAGATIYDFLAGASRYKTTLVPRGDMLGQDLHWGVLHEAKSLVGLGAQAKESASFLKKRSKKLLRF